MSSGCCRVSYNIVPNNTCFVGCEDLPACAKGDSPVLVGAEEFIEAKQCGHDGGHPADVCASHLLEFARSLQQRYTPASTWASACLPIEQDLGMNKWPGLGLLVGGGVVAGMAVKALSWLGFALTIGTLADDSVEP